MIIKYALFAVVIALIPYNLFIHKFPVSILEPVKNLYFDVLYNFIDNIDKLKYFVGFETPINSASKLKKEKLATEKYSEYTIFTDVSLKKFDGRESEQLYLSILGNVFDVTNGKKYYSSDGDYNVFVGRDVSRAFITGDFTEEGLSDDVIDLSYEELRSLKYWLEFYHKNYEYKGKLVGRYFDERGRPTLYNHKLTSRIEQAELDEADKKQSKLIYPPCNVEWTAEEGSRVWCTKRSGGIDRDWVGVPRKLFRPESQTFRCACVNLLNLSESTFAKEPLRSGNLEEYVGCHPEASSCYVQQ